MKIKCQETESFHNVSHSFLSTTKSLERIISYSKKYLDITSDYTEALKSLNTKFTPKQKLQFHNPIDEHFHRLQIVVQAQIKSLSTLIDSVKLEIKKCKVGLDEQIECQKKFQKEMIDAEDDYSTKFDEIKQAKRNYDTDAAALENCLKSLEKKRRITMKNSMDTDDDLGSCVEYLINSERKYSKLITRSNVFKGTFIDRAMASTGSTHQLQNEIERIGRETVFNMMLCMQMSGKKVSLEVDTFASEIEQLLQPRFNGLNDKGGLLSSSSSSSSSAFDYLQDFHFEPYKLKLFSHDTIDGLSEEERHNVIKGMYEAMKQKATEYDVEFEGKKIQMNTVIRKLLSFNLDLHLKKEEITGIGTAIKDKRLREYFLQRLSDLRNRGEFQWPKMHYMEVGRVLKLILNEIVTNFDMETTKNVIILSQTFYYKESTLPSAKKVFLQIAIQQHPLFQKADFWEQYMLDAIEKQLEDYVHKKEKQKLRSKETNEESQMKLNNIIFSQVVSITNNMVDFDLNKELIEQILNNVLLKYPIDEVNEETVYSIINKNDSNDFKACSMKRYSRRKLSGDDMNINQGNEDISIGRDMRKSMSLEEKNSDTVHANANTNADNDDMTMLIKSQTHYMDISSKPKSNEVKDCKEKDWTNL